MVSNDKTLSVLVDSNLTWSDHIEYLTKKISSNTWLLSKNKNILSMYHRIQFYKSYIQSHVDFCNYCRGSSPEYNKPKIFKLVKLFLIAMFVMSMRL